MDNASLLELSSISFCFEGPAKAVFHYNGGGKKVFLFEFESDLVVLKTVYLSAAPFSPKMSRICPYYHGQRAMRGIIFDFGEGKEIVATIMQNRKDQRFACLEFLEIGGVRFEKPTLMEIQKELARFFKLMANERCQKNKGEISASAAEQEKKPVKIQNACEPSLPMPKWARKDERAESKNIQPGNFTLRHNKQKIPMR